jgi:hypothetical protein
MDSANATLNQNSPPRRQIKQKKIKKPGGIPYSLRLGEDIAQEALRNIK